MPTAAEEAFSAPPARRARVVSHPLDTARARARARGACGVGAPSGMGAGHGVRPCVRVRRSRCPPPAAPTMPPASGDIGRVARAGAAAAPTSPSGGGTWRRALGCAAAAPSAARRLGAPERIARASVRARALPAIERAAPEWTPSSAFAAHPLRRRPRAPRQPARRRRHAAAGGARRGRRRRAASTVAPRAARRAYGGNRGGPARVPHTCLTWSRRRRSRHCADPLARPCRASAEEAHSRQRRVTPHTRLDAAIPSRCLAEFRGARRGAAASTRGARSRARCPPRRGPRGALTRRSTGARRRR